MKRFLILTAMLFTLMAAATAQTQCKAIKKNKEQCKITTVNADGYCRYHDPKAPRCTFIKKNGERCKMIVKDQVLYCRFHVGGKVQKVN